MPTVHCTGVLAISACSLFVCSYTTHRDGKETKWSNHHSQQGRNHKRLVSTEADHKVCMKFLYLVYICKKQFTVIRALFARFHFYISYIYTSDSYLQYQLPILLMKLYK